jgi:hypothetical protein
MSLRFPYLAFLALLAAVVTSLCVMSGNGRTASRAERQLTQTHAPSNTDDDSVWQTASQIITSNESSIQISKSHARVATFAHDQAATLLRFSEARQ